MPDGKQHDDRRSKESDQSDNERDDFTPAVLNEGPKKYRYDDWASI